MIPYPTKLAFATFHILLPKNRRVPLPSVSGSGSSLQQLSSSIVKVKLNLSGDGNNSNSSSDKDWFLDGKSIARQLKMDLGITDDKEDGGVGTNNTAETDEAKNKFTVSNDAMEAGRAAARALLMDRDGIDDDDKVGESESIESSKPRIARQLASTEDDKMDTKNEASPQQQSSSSESEGYFNLPSRKSHCYTICMVPPSAATTAWEQLTSVRKECKDPGFYRWPPHANILYPFIEPIYDKESNESKETQRIKFRNELAIQLSNAAKRCEAFDVTIDTFGTFGGKQRGVLWGYPRSSFAEHGNSNSDDIKDNEDEEEPLITLHQLLEEQFPMCKDQRKGGEFNPHMTVSHYATNVDALAAKERVMSSWKSVNFHVPEIYLLERKGDDGQFKIAATIPLGSGGSDKDVMMMHDPAESFDGMPLEEEDWVYHERMEMKNRRKRGNKRRKSRKQGADSSAEEE